jgi:hypothetical protein
VLEFEQILGAMVDRIGNIDPAGSTRGFHSSRHVHRIAPYVVDDLRSTTPWRVS